MIKAKSFAHFFSRSDRAYRKLVQKAKEAEIKNNNTSLY